jgi:transposase/DNA-binding protein Fis
MTYNLDIINLFINYYINGNNLITISKNLNISIPTLKRWYFLYENNINNKIPLTYNYLIKKRKIHGSNKIEKYKDIVIKYVNNNEGCILNDIYEHVNKDLSKPSICRILKSNNISRKRCNIRVVCKDINKIEELRKDFSKHIDNNIFLESEFIDETSFCVNDIFNYGYSNKGKEILKITKHSRNKERLTLLSSISKDSIKYQIIKGSVNSDIYLNFIDKNKEYFKNRNLVQDNARIHHSKKVKEFCKEQKINMVYNPPYTPEFNPIELVFNKLKTEFKKLDHKNIEYEIHKCLKKITNKDINNTFNHSLKFINKYK